MKKSFCLFIIALVYACGASRQTSGQGGSFSVRPGEDLTDCINRNTAFHEFLLGPGTYTAGNGQCITRSHIVIRKKDPSDEVMISDPLQICGDGNTIDGLCWDADRDKGIRRSDPATLAISGSHNTIRNCIFRNFRSTENGNKILSIGRLSIGEGRFLNTVADSNLIESCTFDNWGLRGEPRGSVKSSACITVGREDDKGKFRGTTIRNNLFVNGPYKEYGYNAACKIFNAVLLENNIFFGGQECLEIKYGNSTIRGNTIHHFSGYNILANRYGKNNLYEDNIVYDVEPIDDHASAQGFMIWECGNTVFRNNLIYRCAKTGQIPGRESLKNDVMEYVLIENNSFINNGGGIHFENKMGGARHIVITRNIFYNARGSGGFNALLNDEDSSLEYYGDNLYWGLVRGEGDQAPRIADPQFTDTAGDLYSIQGNPVTCGYGAFPCGRKEDKKEGGLYDPAHYIILYPTKDKWVFHIGLAGLDILPESLEIETITGILLIKRSFDKPGLKLISNIDLRSDHRPDYIVKIHIASGDIIKYIHIE